MATVPPYLKNGDAIGMIAPAGYMPFEKMETCINTLQQWGYKVETGETTKSSSLNYFSGTDEVRLNDLQQMLDNKNIKAIFRARGGYGVSRLIDKLNFKKFTKRPKWIIGFSDITVLHSHIYSRYGIASLHSPMAAAFNDGEAGKPFILSLKSALEGKKIKYTCPAHQFNKTGKAKGELVGGNLALLAHLVGTPSDINTKNKIPFIEDVGEYLYNIDRMLLQLKRSGKLKRLAGLIIGGFTDYKDTDRPYGKAVYEIINEQVKEFKYPICFEFPVSHEKENYALKIGVNYKFSVRDSGVELDET